MSATWDVVFTGEFDENSETCFEESGSVPDLTEMDDLDEDFPEGDEQYIQSSSSDGKPSSVSADDEDCATCEIHAGDVENDSWPENQWDTEDNFWGTPITVEVSETEDFPSEWNSEVVVDWEIENAAEAPERQPFFTTILVDTPEKFDEFLPILSHLWEGVPELACDCEGGKEFGRNGVLTFFSLTVLSLRNTYLLDVWELGKLNVQVFEQENEDGLSLKKVLGSNKYLQLWFDVRADWDTLYHKFGVTPGRIVDLQLLELLSRNGRKDKIVGLYRVMKKHGLAFMSRDELDTWLSEKEGGKDFFNEHVLQYGVLEEERPISEITKKYIAGDTDCMFSLYEHLSNRLSIWEKETQITKPKKAPEPGEDPAELPKPEEPVEAPVVAETKPSVPESQSVEPTKSTATVEPSTEEDWMTFLEKQSTLRAELAMYSVNDPEDHEGIYRAPEAFLEISRMENDSE